MKGVCWEFLGDVDKDGGVVVRFFYVSEEL